MKLFSYFLVITGLLLLSACQADKPTSQPDKQQPPSSTQQTQPERANDNIEDSAKLTLDIFPVPLTAADKAKAVLCNCVEESSYQWAVNGRLIAMQTTDSLEKQFFKRGDAVSLTVNCGDTILNADAVVKNTPPSITDVKFKDPVLAAGKALTVIPAAIDIDGDLVEYSYEWVVDGIYQESYRESTLPGALLNKGTNVVLAVTPDDGIDSGLTFQGLSLTIPNSPPVITSEPPPLTSAQYNYQVIATDLDNDRLNYALNQGPPGMTIDAASGLLSWTVTPDTPREIYEIAFSVKDEEGAQARQYFSLSLSNAE
jgi:hypothetical protein